jgi:hypothetical protein
MRAQSQSSQRTGSTNQTAQMCNTPIKQPTYWPLKDYATYYSCSQLSHTSASKQKDFSGTMTPIGTHLFIK